jgi:hypothetical protein
MRGENEPKRKHAMAEPITEENKTMMMDPSLMDDFTKEWWNLTRMQILQRSGAPASDLAREPTTVVMLDLTSE